MEPTRATLASIAPSEAQRRIRFLSPSRAARLLAGERPKPFADSRPLRIALLNYADVQNYGDILFPMIAAQELRARLPNAAIDYISPSGVSLPHLPSLRFDLAKLEDYDAVLLAGGEIVHRYDQMLSSIYQRIGRSAINQPTDLVFAWTKAQRPFKAWLALGVPELTAEARESIAQALPGLDLVVARGSASQRRLLECGCAPQKLFRTADIGWLFPRLLTEQTAAKLPASVGSRPYVVVHTLPHLTGADEQTKLIAALRQLQAAYDMDVVLLPLTTCWEDEKTLAEIAAAAGDEFLLIDHDVDVLVKLRLLMGCQLYVGQSMHGLISALAAGRPAGLSHPDRDDKFRELLADLHLSDSRIDNWSGVARLAQHLLSRPNQLLLACRSQAVAQVEQLFDRVAHALVEHVTKRG